MDNEMKEFKTEIKMINSKAIFCDKYQREIKMPRVKRIVKYFNPNLVNPIKVSYRGGKYYVFDGQHTLAALKERNGGEDLMVECKVFYGMSYEDEANLFAEQFGFAVKPTTDETLFARYEARDIDVMEFKETIEYAGFICDFKKQTGTWRIACYKQSFDTFRKYGADFFADELGVLASTWFGSEGSVRREIIGGLALYMADFAGQYDRDRLIKKLQKTTPEKIIRDSQLKDYPGVKKVERVIFDIYNNGLGEKRKLKWKE